MKHPDILKKLSWPMWQQAESLGTTAKTCGDLPRRRWREASAEKKAQRTVSPVNKKAASTGGFFTGREGAYPLCAPREKALRRDIETESRKPSASPKMPGMILDSSW